MNPTVNQWLKVLLVALVVLAASKVFGQGCAQCKQDVEQSSIDPDSIGITENTDLKRRLLFYYVGIPIAVVISVLAICVSQENCFWIPKVNGKVSGGSSTFLLLTFHPMSSVLCLKAQTESPLD